MIVDSSDCSEMLWVKVLRETNIKVKYKYIYIYIYLVTYHLDYRVEKKDSWMSLMLMERDQ